MVDFQRVLITGGAGFIGANYVQFARRQHPAWEIRVLDKLTYAGNLRNLEPVQGQFEFIHGDIADPEVVAAALRGVDAVVHFAAESHVDRSLNDPRPFVETNVLGTLVLLAAAQRQGVARFLHISTDEVYGDLAGTTIHSVESDPFHPRSPYAASKAAAEHFVFSYAASYGLDVVVTRGSNTYGPYQYPEKIIPLFITHALQGKPLPVYGDGSAVRDYLHVEDHVAGIDLALHRGAAGEAYNLGARLAVNGREVAERILQLLDKPADLLTYVTDRPGHDYRYSVDPGKAEALGWGRRWTFSDGLARTVEWYVAHETWWREVQERQRQTLTATVK
ncbi:MAG: dTDP-glucose 4,6-dehydratase [Armatimonadota bacterium]